MTRLRPRDIAHIAADLPAWDDQLKSKTGLTLRQLACKAAGFDETVLLPVFSSVRAAVVPVCSGRGIIGGFAHNVWAILEYIGLTTLVTAQTDVAGITAAVEGGCRLVFMADDERFIALDVKSGGLVDNGDATGKAFAVALDAAAGGVSGREVLILGCGPVGVGVAFTLAGLGAHVALYDPDLGRSRDLEAALQKRFDRPVGKHHASPPPLSRYRLIVDACCGTDIIPPGSIYPDTYVAAPGMPPGLNEVARQKMGHRLLHDPLQSGVAAMAAIALARIFDPHGGRR